MWTLLAATALAPAYRLVWADEFDSAVIDRSKWTFETGFVRNQEAQLYRPENARIENGCLILEGRRERVLNPGYEPGSQDWRKSREFAEYTSACVKTQGRGAWKFGRFEIRARIDARPGLWPAIWMLGTQGGWPRCGEIDLMEFYQETILANTAWADGTWNTVKVPYRHFVGRDPDWAKSFHTWRMDWDESFIRIYLDGELLNETDLTKTLNKDGTNPFHREQYLLLNLAIGSTGGDPGKTEFPAKFEIDWVRVYQKA